MRSAVGLYGSIIRRQNGNRLLLVGVYNSTHSQCYHKFYRETKALLCPLMFEIQVIGLLQPSDSLRSHYHKTNKLNVEKDKRDATPPGWLETWSESPQTHISSLILCSVSGLGLTEGRKHSLVFRGFPNHTQKILKEDKFWSEEELRRVLVLQNMSEHIAVCFDDCWNHTEMCETETI
jgi:hypothetical protein